MSNTISQVQVKRTTKSFTQLDNLSTKLKYGEPLENVTEKVLILGDQDENNLASQDLMIRLVNKDQVNNGLFYDATTSKLTNPDGTEITLPSSVLDTSGCMTKVNPTGSGSLSINRLASSATGTKSAAINNNTTASGSYSFATGDSTVASGQSSFATGQNTKATAPDSTAEGLGTSADSSYQHVQGKYNIKDSSNVYADIIGNGTADGSRSNAYSLDWAGNGYFAGNLYVGSGTNANGTRVAKETQIAPQYSASTAYGVGTIVLYNGTLYRCKAATTAGTAPTNTTYWEVTTLVAGSTAALTFSTTGNGSSGSYNGTAAKTISYNTVGAAASGHTHNYAASSSAGGPATNLNVNATTSNSNYYILGATGTGSQAVYRAYNSSGSKNTTGIYFNGASGVLYGAAWNDFAEFRKTDAESGEVVCEVGDGSLVKSNERLQAGAAVISDTYGMIIGPDEEGYQPIAVAGRVLVYPNTEETFKAGDCVCSGPDGTVSVMTREEIKEYPDRILGTVSEIPTYDNWNGIMVNGRIWIKVK